MRLVGVEEHFLTTGVLAAGWAQHPSHRDLAFTAATEEDTGRRLCELGDERLAAMDRTGLDVQVLSLTTPGVQNLPARQAVSLQCTANDLLAETVRAQSGRFQGLAALATSAPTAAADELARAVSGLGFNGAMIFGRTGQQNLDHSDYWPIFEAAEALRAPLHLHPQSPPKAVRKAYYSGLGDSIDVGMATFGLGWHYDAGIQFLRLVLSGVFDRFPRLQVILGHWGELLLFFMERIEQLAALAKLPRTLSDYARANLYVAPSGILSHRYLRWAIEIMGAERILFSTDYPFEAASRSGARRFLQEANLSDTDRELMASGNWERLCADIRR